MSGEPTATRGPVLPVDTAFRHIANKGNGPAF
jgi:hypothetical protein